jgi:hypothetical protein
LHSMLPASPEAVPTASAQASLPIDTPLASFLAVLEESVGANTRAPQDPQSQATAPGPVDLVSGNSIKERKTQKGAPEQVNLIAVTPVIPFVPMPADQIAPAALELNRPAAESAGSDSVKSAKTGTQPPLAGQFQLQPQPEPMTQITAQAAEEMPLQAGAPNSEPVPKAPDKDATRIPVSAGAASAGAEMAFALRLTPQPATIRTAPAATVASRPALLQTPRPAVVVTAELAPAPANAQPTTKSAPVAPTQAAAQRKEQATRSNMADGHTDQEPTSSAPRTEASKSAEGARSDHAVTNAAMDSVAAPAPHVLALGAIAAPAPDVTISAPPSARELAAKPDAPAAAQPVEAVDDLAPAVGAAKEIFLRVASAENHKIEVRLVERAGEVHVSVRTPDESLARSMREELGSLTGKLIQSGFSTESYAPRVADSWALSDHRVTDPNSDAQSDARRGTQDQSSGGRSSQDGRGRRPAWVEELENLLAKSQNERSNAWPLNR